MGPFAPSAGPDEMDSLDLFFSIKYNPFSRKIIALLFGKLKEGVNKSMFWESWKCDTGERGNWSKILFRMLCVAAAAREAKVSLFHYFFHILHLHWILSLRHFLTQDTSPSYTFPGQLCFILSFLFPNLRCRQISNLMQWILPEFYALSQI